MSNPNTQSFLEQAGVSPEEVEGLKALPFTLFCRRRFDATADIPVNGFDADAAIKFFHVGVGDLASKLGYASGNVDRSHTNLEEEGKLPKGELAIVTGIGFELEEDADDDFRRAILRADVRLVEKTNSYMNIGRVKELPPRNAQVIPFGSGATSGQLYNAQAGGPIYTHTRPLVTLRGGPQSDDTQIHLANRVAVAASALAADQYLECQFYGVRFARFARD